MFMLAITLLGQRVSQWDALDRQTLYAYRCNGLSIGYGSGCESDRVSQTVDGVTTHYVLDQAAGLTQVLSDGTYTYLYGNGRIGQFTAVSAATDSAYFLTDALGSVRQLANSAGVVTLNESYDPYGERLSSVGSAASIYGFDGEQFDPATGLTYLRARYYASGRFLTRDTWLGDDRTPMSYNAWLFGYSNPVKYVDPSGNISICPFMSELDCLSFFGAVPDYKGLAIVQLNKSAFDRAAAEIEAKGLHKTTIAAAIAVQSQWLDYPVDRLKGFAYNLRYLELEYFGCVDPRVARILKGAGVGYAKSGEFDKYGNLFIMSNSIKAMTDHIQPVVDECKWAGSQCNQKDRLIAAAMAQNTAFGWQDMREVAEKNWNDRQGSNLEINWTNYFVDNKYLWERHPGDLYALLNDVRSLWRKNYNTRFMLQLFTQDMVILHSVFGWDLPPEITTSTLESMMSLALWGK